MEIIDIHAHVYPTVCGITNSLPMTSQPLGRVKVGNEIRQFLPPSFHDTTSTVETLIAYMDWCGISRAVLMANPYYGYHNDYFIRCVQQYPERLRAVALVDLTKGAAAAEELERLYQQTPLMGFKVETDSTFQCARQMHMADEALRPVWECIDRHAQPVFLHLFTDRDVEDTIQLVNRYSNISFILCHMGADACFSAGVKKSNFDELIALVRDHGNVWFDTSTVPVYFQEEYPFPTSVEIIEKAWREVGAKKLMWSSDYPGMLNHATMRQLINLVAVQCRNIPPADRERILGLNAKELFFDVQNRAQP